MEKTACDASVACVVLAAEIDVSVTQLVGIVSSHDLAAAIDAPEDAALRTLMSTDVVSVSPEAPAVEAVGLMIDAKYGALPVVTSNGELVGIITATDFLAVAQHALLGEPIEREAGEI